MHLTDEETEAQRPERACSKPSNFKHMCSVSGVRRGRGEERVGRAEAGRWEADLAPPEQEMVGRGGHSLLGAGNQRVLGSFQVHYPPAGDPSK